MPDDSLASVREGVAFMEVLHLEVVQKLIDMRKGIVRLAASSESNRRLVEREGYHVSDEEIAYLRELEAKDAD